MILNWDFSPFLPHWPHPPKKSGPCQAGRPTTRRARLSGAQVSSARNTSKGRPLKHSEEKADLVHPACDNFSSCKEDQDNGTLQHSSFTNLRAGEMDGDAPLTPLRRLCPLALGIREMRKGLSRIQGRRGRRCPMKIAQYLSCSSRQMPIRPASDPAQISPCGMCCRRRLVNACQRERTLSQLVFALGERGGAAASCR
jgi:hypothetical protein